MASRVALLAIPAVVGLFLSQVIVSGVGLPREAA